MAVNHLFVGYMVVVGLLIGAVLVVWPHLGDFWLKPYFWVMATSFVFDAVVVLFAREASGVNFASRMAGFAVGIGVMILVLHLTGSPARYA